MSTPHAATHGKNGNVSAERRWDGVLPSARAAVATAGALLLAFPLLLAAVDHHAVERNPGHEHALAGGESIPQHTHEFQRPHDHAAPLSLDVLPARIVTSRSAAVGVLSIIQSLALPVLLVIVVASASRRARHATAEALIPQVAFAPPTPPPAFLPAL